MKIEYIDNLRGIGIMLIVLGHTSSPFSNYVYQFHVPLFFFISGYLFNSAYFDNPIRFINKRINRLYLKYIYFGVTFILLHNIFFKLNIYNISYNADATSIQLYNLKDTIIEILKTIIFRNREQLLGGFWFIPALFLMESLYCLVGAVSLQLKKTYNFKIYLLPIILIFFFLGNIISNFDVRLPYYLNIVFAQILFFYMGVLYRKNEERIHFNFYSALLISIVLVFTSLYFNVDVSNNNHYSDKLPFAIALILFPFVALSGIYILIYIARNITNKYISIFFQYVGRNTLFILGVHFISFKIVSYLIILNYDLPLKLMSNFPYIDSIGLKCWWPLYWFVGLFVPLIIKFLFDKRYFFFNKTKIVDID